MNTCFHCGFDVEFEELESRAIRLQLGKIKDAMIFHFDCFSELSGSYYKRHFEEMIFIIQDQKKAVEKLKMTDLTDGEILKMLNERSRKSLEDKVT